MNTPHPSRWGDLFDQAVSIIDQANSSSPIVGHWSFGGGTALMLQINHRDSHDVDIFINDPQILPFLNPETQDYKLDIEPDGYETDGAGMLKITFDGVGEVDFICAGNLTENAYKKTCVRERNVNLETPAEIIAKKIYYRGSMIQPRDIFDIASVVSHHGDDYLISALSAHKVACGRALEAARKMDDRFAESIMSALMHRANHAELVGDAQKQTIRLLEKICA